MKGTRIIGLDYKEINKLLKSWENDKDRKETFWDDGYYDGLQQAAIDLRYLIKEGRFCRKE